MSAVCMETSNVVSFIQYKRKKFKDFKGPEIVRNPDTPASAGAFSATNLLDYYSGLVIPRLPLTRKKAENSNLRKINAKHPNGMTLQDITAYLEEHLKRYKPQTVRNVAFQFKGAVISYYGDAYDLDFALQTTIDRTFKKWTSLKRVPARIIVPTLKQVMQLIDEALERDSALIEFLLFSALRISELCSLRLSDFNTDHLTPDGGIYYTVRQKGGSIDTRELRYDVYKRIREVFKGKVFLFEKTDGTPFDRHHALFRCKMACRKVFGHGTHFSPHKFRHAFAQWFYNASPEMLPAIMKHGGWRNVQTFIQFYQQGSLKASDVPSCAELRRMVYSEEQKKGRRRSNVSRKSSTRGPHAKKDMSKRKKGD